MQYAWDNLKTARMPDKNYGGKRFLIRYIRRII